MVTGKDEYRNRSRLSEDGVDLLDDARLYVLIFESVARENDKVNSLVLSEFDNLPSGL
jgi:hypothetical protein